MLAWPYLAQGRVLLHEEGGEAGDQVRGQLRGREPGQQAAGHRGPGQGGHHHQAVITSADGALSEERQCSVKCYSSRAQEL